MRWNGVAGRMLVGVGLLGVGFGVGRSQAKLQADPAMSAGAASAQLTALLKEMREDELKHSPELASSLGDRRYNDQVSDLSPRAYNDALARDRGYLARLAVIDTTGLSAKEKQQVEQVETGIVEREQGARAKAWEMPFDSSGAVPASLAAKEGAIRFETVKDYDDWVVRLGKVPAQLRQVIENVMAGMDEKRLQPATTLEAAVKQAKAVAESKPEETVFAEPLKRFPAGVSAVDRKRITEATLAAIQDEVQPACARLARFLTSQALSAAAGKP